MENKQKHTASWLEPFGDETLLLVCRALGAQQGCFYRLGGALRPFGIRTRDELGLLHPVRLVSRGRRFLTTVDVRAESPEVYRNLQTLLQSYGAQEAGEMLFYREQQPVAGVSLIWARRPSDYHATRELGLALQAFVEFNMTFHWCANGVHMDDSAQDFVEQLTLTGRESQVVLGVCQGKTNIEIARRLNIAVSTVKTHLIHVFKKIGVTTRGELISHMLSAQPGFARKFHPLVDVRAPAA